jgi:hypothetical protein
VVNNAGAGNPSLRVARTTAPGIGRPSVSKTRPRTEVATIKGHANGSKADSLSTCFHSTTPESRSRHRESVGDPVRQSVHTEAPIGADFKGPPGTFGAGRQPVGTRHEDSSVRRNLAAAAAADAQVEMPWFLDLEPARGPARDDDRLAHEALVAGLDDVIATFDADGQVERAFGIRETRRDAPRRPTVENRDDGSRNRGTRGADDTPNAGPLRAHDAHDAVFPFAETVHAHGFRSESCEIEGDQSITRSTRR